MPVKYRLITEEAYNEWIERKKKLPIPPPPKKKPPLQPIKWVERK